MDKSPVIQGTQLDRVRRLLVLLLVLFQAITVVAILAVTRLGTERVMLQQAQKLLESATAESVTHTRTFLNSAEETATTTAMLLSADVLDTGNYQQLEDYFASVLTNNLAFEGIYYGSLNGDFIFVSRDNTTNHPLRVKIVNKKINPVGAQFHWRGQDPAQFNYKYDSSDSFDPRTRPWFSRSLQNTGRANWTEPYIFFTTKQLGVTTAIAVLDKHSQRPIGVIGVDLPLHQLADFLAHLKISDSGSAFVASADGVLIAAPFAGQPIQLASTQLSDEQLQTNSSIADIAGRAAVSTIRNASIRDNNGSLRFSIASTEYLADHKPLTLSDGQQWLVGTFAPETDFLSGIRSNERSNIIVSGIVLMISMLIGWFLATSAWTPVEAWHRQANLDQLTQLFNRRYLARAAKKLFEQAFISKNPVTVAIVDIDHFKRINDSLGHSTGDKVIAEVAHRLREGSRSGDVVARLGGEEFVLVLPNTNPDIAKTIIGRMADTLKTKPIMVENGAIGVTFSAGIAARQTDCTSYEKTLGRADKALYLAKRTGRDRIELDQDEKKPRLDGALSAAIENFKPCDPSNADKKQHDKAQA